MSFFNNLFGTISGAVGLNRAGAGADFIPVDNKGNVIKIKGGDAKWLGMRNRVVQKEAYEFCFPVASVVDRLAEYDLTAKTEILRWKGKGKEDFATGEWANRMNTLLDQPNGLQTWEQFRGQQTVYKKVFGFCPVLPLIPTGFEGEPWMANALINLPPWLFDPVHTRNKLTAMSRLGDFVKEYRINILGDQIILKAEDVLILTDSFIQDSSTDYILPLSRLVGLDMAISNICAAMEADNVLLRKKGPLGFISHDAATKDQVSYSPMTKRYKNELQNALQKYGLSWSHFQYVISRTAARWVPMSYNVHELDTSGTILKCEKAICHRYAFPYILYEEQDATYANGDNAAASVYQSNVIPNNNKDMNKYNKFFKARENNCNIVGNFEDVGALQEDKEQAAQARNTLNTALEIEYNNDLMSRNQWRELMGWDKIPGDDLIKSDKLNNSQPIALKLGPEGMNSLIAILNNTGLDVEAKKSALIILFGLQPAEADKLTIEKEVDPKLLPPGPAKDDDFDKGIKPLKINLG